jgi:hypothetical protein
MMKALGKLPADFQSINGSCGTSSSSWNACDFSYEAHKQGRASVAMAAVPQSGKAAELYGGIYLTNFPPDMSFVNIMAGDHYAQDSNELSKMDIVTRTFDPNNEVFQHLNRQGIDPSLSADENSARCQQVESRVLSGSELKKLKKNGCRVELIYCGKIPSAPPQRKIERKPEATAPLEKATTGPAKTPLPPPGEKTPPLSKTPAAPAVRPLVPGKVAPVVAPVKPTVKPITTTPKPPAKPN